MATLEEIKRMIFQLPIQQQIILMMQLAEAGFTEWNDEEEDICNT